MVIEENAIWGGSDAGVVVYDSSLGHIAKNDIYENELAGIEIKTCGGCADLIVGT